LLDTNIVLAYVRRNVLGAWIETRYALNTSPAPSLINIVTAGEIRSLARQFNWGSAKLQYLNSFLAQVVVVNLDAPGIVEAYALLDDHSRRTGISMGKNDVWIAATAHVTGARLLTTDQDFDHLHPAFLSRDWIDPNSGR
jgi:predicted nucleic acid-binding protein